MTMKSKRGWTTLGIGALLLLSGCSSHDLVTAASRPGKFKLYNCDQLNKRGEQLAKREGELQALMQKAAQGPGGEIAIALAYKGEYTTVQGDLREVEITGAEKKCVLKYRSVSEGVVR